LIVLDSIVGLLMNFEIAISPAIALGEIDALTQFAVRHKLTAYDAAYLRIAFDHGARLATVDIAMRDAARRLDIRILPA
jgi:predicted nucleic acid-binding protein